MVPEGPFDVDPFGVLATGPGEGTLTTTDAGTVRGLDYQFRREGRDTSLSGIGPYRG